MECIFCHNVGHILRDSKWVRCTCLFDKQILALADKMSIDEKILNDTLRNKFYSLKDLFETCMKRFSANTFLKYPLLILGENKNLLNFEFTFSSLLIKASIFNFISLSTFDLIDSYFNNISIFKSYITSKVIFIRLGDEVPNEGCIQVIKTILISYSRNLLYPVFLFNSLSQDSFFERYPNLKEIFNQYKVKVFLA